MRGVKRRKASEDIIVEQHRILMPFAYMHFLILEMRKTKNKKRRGCGDFSVGSRVVVSR